MQAWQVGWNRHILSFKVSLVCLWFRDGKDIFSLMDGENHGTAEVGKSLWRMSIPTPLFTAGQLEQAAHDCATFWISLKTEILYPFWAICFSVWLPPQYSACLAWSLDVFLQSCFLARKALLSVYGVILPIKHSSQFCIICKLAESTLSHHLGH